MTKADASDPLEELTAMVEDVLRPLVRVDGGDVELVAAGEGSVLLRVSGSAAFGPGSERVRQQVLCAGVRKVLGDVEVAFDKAVPRPGRVTSGAEEADGRGAAPSEP